MVIIEYQNWGGHPKDKFWIAYDNETKEAIDYGTKQHLINLCKRNKLCYQVRQYHRKGGFSVVQSNCG